MHKGYYAEDTGTALKQCHEKEDKKPYHYPHDWESNGEVFLCLGGGWLSTGVYRMVA